MSEDCTLARPRDGRFTFRKSRGTDGSPAGPANLRLQVILERNRIVVQRVARAVDERDGASTSSRYDRPPRVWPGIELTEVTSAKRRPLVWIVVEPLSQFRAGSDVFEPRIDAQPGLCEAAGPQALDEKTGTVVSRLRLVSAFQFQHHRPDFFWQGRTLVTRPNVHAARCALQESLFQKCHQDESARVAVEIPQPACLCFGQL